MTERKRRKWDVAAPQGIPINSSVVGTGAGGTLGVAGQATQLTAYAPLPAPAVAKPVVAPGKPGQPLDADTIARAQQGAAAIVAKLNQELAAQGKLPQGRGGHARGGAAEDPGVFREVPINDAPAELRHHLTKRPTQDDIARRTGTQIVTRGRYLPPGTQPAEGERPLHLHIAPGASATQDDAEKRRTCDAAAAEVQGIMQGRMPPHGGPYAPPPRAAFNAVGPPQQAYGLAPPGGQAYAGPVGQPVPGAPGFQCTSLWVGFEAAPEFQLVQRLRGPGDSFLQHIGTETSATVALRGQGSGVQEMQPLHIYVAAATPKAFGDAARLAQNLIDTVRAEHAKHAPYAAQPAPQQQQGGAYGAGGPIPGHGVPPPHVAAAYGFPPPGAAYPPPGAYPPPHAAPGAPGYPMPYMAAAAYPPPYAPMQGYAPHQGYRPPPAAGAPYGPPQPYGAPPPQAAASYPAATSAPGYPPPYHQAYPAPYAHPAPQAPAAANGATAPLPDRVGHPPQQQQQQPSAEQAGQGGQGQSQSAQAEGEQRRKRFREFKEDKQAAQEPPPYYAQLSSGGAAPAPVMGPPPPRQVHTAMGPPPDRRPQSTNGFQPMGPPPPRQPAHKAAGASAGEAQGVFGGLVEYGDED